MWQNGEYCVVHESVQAIENIVERHALNEIQCQISRKSKFATIQWNLDSIVNATFYQVKKKYHKVHNKKLQHEF